MIELGHKKGINIMTKKKKILIALGSLILFFALIATSFYSVLRTSSKTIDNVLIKMAEKAEEKREEKIKKTEGEKGKTEIARIRKEREEIKSSKLMTTQNPEITPLEIQQTRGYEKTWGSINTINRVALWLRSRDSSNIDDPSVSNDETLDVIFFTTSMFSPNTFNNLLTLDADGVYYASMEAMHDPDIRWETKYFIAQLLGERGERRALPLFRDIVADENEAFLVRITSIDQIGTMKDTESNGLVLSLLDNESSIMRDKASAILRDTTEKGDDQVYEQVLAHYYAENDPSAKDCLLGTVMTLGGEKSFADIDKILEMANDDQKETVAIILGNIHTEASFEMLKKLYDPQNENSFSLVIKSLANLEMRDANEFLYGIIEKANGLNSVMAASYLVEDHNQMEAIPYIEEAMGKETNPEFINNYQELLVKFHQSGGK